LVFNGDMRRSLLALPALLAALAMTPAGALASVVEVGQIPPSATPAAATAQPTCPTDPCLAVSRTTGYQARVGSDYPSEVVPADGRIVAWTVQLGSPNAKQLSFFNTNEGGASEAGINVLVPRPKLNYSLVASSPLVLLQPYFGETAQFPLTNTLAVKKGDVIALNVPTWAPALALGFGSDTSWRASRPRSGCSNTTNQTAQTVVASTVQYICLYRTARLTYSATLVTNPVPKKTTTTKKTVRKATARRARAHR
jgi:hypothetical protein